MWPVGTLCITIAANIADTAILGFDSCFPDSVIGFIPDDKKADARFIKYLFDALLQRRYKQFTQGAAQDNLSQAKLLSLKFPIPVVAEQKQIADVLSAYDDLIENNRRRIQLLEQAARLLYKEWFVHLRFPGHEHTTINDGLPEGWEKTTIGESSSFLSRGITPKYDDNAPGIVINQKCIRNRMVNLGLARRQSKQVPPAKLVQFGDVLINSTGAGTLGRVSQFLLETNGCTVDSHVTIVRPIKDVPVYYFGLHLTGLESYIATLGRGATNQTELSKDDIAALEMVLPSSAQAQMFETTVASLFNQIRILSDQVEKLNQARDLLLPKMMIGEVAV
jgi:type I restriction enzyme S subunit